MWGQARSQANAADKARIIPTRVGTSEKEQRHLSQERDHPHACGDKDLQRRSQRPHLGSSPRVWGQVIRLFENPAELRIIPTRVGTSLNMFVPSSTIQDHPHACGDKFKGYSTRCHFVGSSPRVWGQVMNILQNAQPIRIIPTRVGTSLLHRLLSVRHRDHPHACGDKPILTGKNILSAGSSPRVWGQVPPHQTLFV